MSAAGLLGLYLVEKTFGWGDGLKGVNVNNKKAYVASCVTLMSKSRVPAGDQNNVIFCYHFAYYNL